MGGDSAVKELLELLTFFKLSSNELPALTVNVLSALLALARDAKEPRIPPAVLGAVLAVLPTA